MDFPFGLPIEVVGRAGPWPAQLDLLRDLGRRRLRPRPRMPPPGQAPRRPDAHPPAHRPRGQGPVRLLPLPDHLPDLLRHARRPRPAVAGAGHRHPALPVPQAAAAARRCWSKPAPVRRSSGWACRTRTTSSRPAARSTAQAPPHPPRDPRGPAAARRDHPAHQRVIMRNGGGDALDAVIAAVGGHHAWRAADHDDPSPATPATRARGSCSSDDAFGHYHFGRSSVEYPASGRADAAP